MISGVLIGPTVLLLTSSDCHHISLHILSFGGGGLEKDKYFSLLCVK